MTEIIGAEETAPQAADPNAVTRYIYTYSGRKVELDGEGAPSLLDIAVQLGRIPRFAGATEDFWTVLQHSLCAEQLGRYWCDQYEGIVSSMEPVEVSGRPANMRAYIRLACLIHDAHEALIGDIPSPFKSADMHNVQETFDERLYESLGIPHPRNHKEVTSVVTLVDQALLGAEGKMFGPPTSGDEWWRRVENELTERAQGTISRMKKHYFLKDLVSANGFAVLRFKKLAKELVLAV